MKEAGKCDICDLNNANLEDMFPVVSWKENDPNHFKDHVGSISKTIEAEGDYEAPWRICDDTHAKQLHATICNGKRVYTKNGPKDVVIWKL